MSWKRGLVTKGTGPEEQLWKILDEMGVKYDMNVPEDKWTESEQSFSVYARECDVIVEGVLGIEVQSSGKALHEGKLRHRKDVVKRWSIEARGLGWLEIWDDELERACQDKAGIEWRPLIKEWIHGMLPYAHAVHNAYVEYQSRLPDPPLMAVPGQGMIRLDERRL